MNARMHAALNQFFHIYRVAAPIFACAAINSLSPGLVLLLAGYFALLLLIWLIPVHCEGMGCTGRMQLTTERLSFWMEGKRFKCDNCGAIHYAEIFNPNIEITGEYS